MIVGTAGHIDHGKTALIRALTGTETDRLREEKARGITIDLGFAYADLGGGAITGFIDVPGHERLVHTMLAGAGGIDLALLVVAADDGPMPQTREHLAILDLLGIHCGVVALTKADLACPARLAEVSAAIRSMLAPTGLRGAPVLPVSALTGQGIAELAARLAGAERATGARAAGGRFRMGVDRSFTLAGAGTVVTGTVLSGRVAEGDEVVISPAGLRSRVRSLRAQSRSAAEGRAGQRVALNLAGIAKDAVRRGDVVMTPSLHAPTARVDASLRWLPGDEKAQGKGGLRAHLHVGAAETVARVVALSPPPAPGGEGLVQLVLDHPVAAAWGERFILRDASAQRTLGGGVLLDLRPPARKRAAPERLAHLAAAAAPYPVRALKALSALAPVDLAAFLRDRALPEGCGPALAEAAGAALIAGEGPPLALSAAALTGLREALLAALMAFHAENPEMQGMSRERLRLSLTSRLPKDAFAALLRAEPEVRLETGFVRLASHEVRLAPEDETLWQQIAPHLAGETRFRPPRVRDLAGLFAADEREVRRVLKLTARLGRTDQIAHDHFFARGTVAEMAGIVADVAAQAEGGWITAAAFRDRVHNGRKVAIEILDFFDRHGLTIRRGDLRRVNPHRLDLFGPAAAKVAETPREAEDVAAG